MPNSPLRREQQIMERLAECGISYRIHEHVVSRTVADAAERLSFPTEQLLKTVVFRVKHGPWVLAGCRGEDRIDYRKLAAACGVSRASIVRPGPDEIEAALGDEIGGVSLIAADDGVLVVIDSQAVATLNTVYCGVGRNDKTLEIGIADLIGVTDARVLPLVQQHA